MAAEDPGIWKYFFDHVWVPLAAAVAALWTMLTGQIRDTRQEIHEVRGEVDSRDWISRQDFRDHVEADERVQNQIRDEITSQKDINVRIFDQMREMENSGHNRHIELLTAINAIANRR